MVDMVPETSTPTASQASGSYRFGNRFTVDLAVDVDQFQYYRDDSGSAVPSSLQLWRVSDGAQLSQVTPAATSSIGWVNVAMPATISLSASESYVVSMAGASGFTHRGWATAPPAINDPFNQVGMRYVDVLNTIPTSVGAWELVAVGVRTFGSTPPTPPDDPPTTEPDPGSLNPGGTFAYWLHQATVNPDAFWKADRIVRAAIQSAVDETLELIEALATFGTAVAFGTPTEKVQSVGAVLRAIWTSTDAGKPRMETNLETRISGIGDDVATATADLLSAIGAVPTYTPADLGSFPSSPWTKTDEIAFDTNLAYAEPAHLYVVSFSDLGSNIVNASVAGVPVSYRLAWWCALNGAFATQRSFIDTPSAHLWLNGARMPGLLLRSGAGGSGTVEAWTYG